MQALIKKIKYFSRKVSASRIGAYSAQTAYFMFFSLVPLVVLLLSLVSRLDILSSSEYLTTTAKEISPSILNGFFSDYFSELIGANTLSLTIVSAFVLLWSASKGIFSIIGGLNSVYEVRESRNYFLLRILAVFYTVVFIVILLLALFLMVFGKTIANYMYSLFPNLKGLVYVVSSLRFIIGFLMLVAFFLLLYKALPSKTVRFSDQMPGAMISATGWVSFSILFSFFIDNFSNYSKLYGSLAAVMVLLLWMYVCMYIMFIGAEINFILSQNDN